MPDNNESLSVMKELKIEVMNMRKEMKSFQNTMNSLGKAVQSIESTTKSTNDKLSKFEDMMGLLMERQEKVESAVLQQNERMDNQERLLKKNNIVLYGVEEGEGKESFEVLEEKVISMFREIIVVNINLSDINYIRRIGRKNGNQFRPIVVSLVSFRKKMEILTNKRKLKGHNIFINADLIKKDREERKQLLDHARRLRNEGKTVEVRGTRLFVQGVNYGINQLDDDYADLTAHDDPDCEEANNGHNISVAEVILETQQASGSQCQDSQTQPMKDTHQVLKALTPEPPSQRTPARNRPIPSTSTPNAGIDRFLRPRTTDQAFKPGTKKLQ